MLINSSNYYKLNVMGFNRNKHHVFKIAFEGDDIYCSSRCNNNRAYLYQDHIWSKQCFQLNQVNFQALPSPTMSTVKMLLTAAQNIIDQTFLHLVIPFNTLPYVFLINKNFCGQIVNKILAYLNTQCARRPFWMAW